MGQLDGNPSNSEHRSCMTAQECRAMVGYAGKQTNKLRRYRDIVYLVRQDSAVMNSKWAKVPLGLFNELLEALKDEERELLEDTADA
jgi:hypothetical protein